MQNTQEARIDFFDAARAIAALLGIVLHSAVGYVKHPVAEWPPFGQQSSIFFDIIASSIHTFRVPVFFFLAGFFTYQLFMKLSVLQFIMNRIKRIIIPFICFSLFLNSPGLLNVFYSHELSPKQLLFIFENMSFLWFLEYLVLYYLIFLALYPVYTRLIKLIPSHNALVTTWLQSPWKWLPIVAMNFFFLYMTNAWYTPILLSSNPNFWLLAIYGLYFTLGILLAKHRQFECFFKFSWRQAIIAGLVISAYLFLMLNMAHSEKMRIAAIALYALANYALFILFFSICWTFLSVKNPIFRYLADASYSIYLCHVFVIIWFHSFVVKYFHSIFSQFAATCLLSLVLSVLAYQVFVRKSPKTKATTLVNVS